MGVLGWYRRCAAAAAEQVTERAPKAIMGPVYVFSAVFRSPVMTRVDLDSCPALAADGEDCLSLTAEAESRLALEAVSSSCPGLEAVASSSLSGGIDLDTLVAGDLPSEPPSAWITERSPNVVMGPVYQYFLPPANPTIVILAVESLARCEVQLATQRTARAALASCEGLSAALESEDTAASPAAARAVRLDVASIR